METQGNAVPAGMLRVVCQKGSFDVCARSGAIQQDTVPPGLELFTRIDVAEFAWWCEVNQVPFPSSVDVLALRAIYNGLLLFPDTDFRESYLHAKQSRLGLPRNSSDFCI